MSIETEMLDKIEDGSMEASIGAIYAHTFRRMLMDLDVDTDSWTDLFLQYGKDYKLSADQAEKLIEDLFATDLSYDTFLAGIRVLKPLL